MDTWTLQMGFPVVEVTRDYEANSAQLTQVRDEHSGSGSDVERSSAVLRDHPVSRCG